MGGVFVAFLAVGLGLPVLPLHVHLGLGFGTFMVGIVAGSQFAASLFSRVWAGDYSDRNGAKRGVVIGLAATTLSELLYLLSLGFVTSPTLSVTILLLGRVLLGAAESFVITGAVSWGLARIGAAASGKVIIVFRFGPRKADVAMLRAPAPIISRKLRPKCYAPEGPRRFDTTKIHSRHCWIAATGTASQFASTELGIGVRVSPRACFCCRKEAHRSRCAAAIFRGAFLPPPHVPQDSLSFYWRQKLAQSITTTFGKDGARGPVINFFQACGRPLMSTEAERRCFNNDALRYYFRDVRHRELNGLVDSSPTPECLWQMCVRRIGRTFHPSDANQAS